MSFAHFAPSETSVKESSRSPYGADVRLPIKYLNMKLHSSTHAAAIAVCCAALFTAGLTGCSTVSSPKLSQYEEAERIGNNHLVKFDTLDFDVYTHQKWDRFRESHAADILVHYPD